VAHVEQPAIAGIGIGDDRGAAAARHGADAAHHVGVGGDAGIRHAQMRGHGAEAGGVEAGEAHAIRHLGADHVEDAGGEDELLRREGGARVGLGMVILY
jgi:hypothetical protein